MHADDIRDLKEALHRMLARSGGQVLANAGQVLDDSQRNLLRDFVKVCPERQTLIQAYTKI